ncbi:MAG: hypothetical protein PF961_01645 [Planctomycetota bacterium]|jgi:hypothetical protein|nr:hypothetical protein [Planctomycetota bacterium]
MDPKRTAGVPGGIVDDEVQRLRGYLHLKLAAMGLQLPEMADHDGRFMDVVGDLLADYQEKSRRLNEQLCPADNRLQEAINQKLGEHADGLDLRLPRTTLILDRYGLARECSLPAGQDHFKSDIIESYRVANGVLHNPRSDRRTTKGVFHVCDCEFPVPADKIAIPKRTFACLLHYALQPPADLMGLPYTAKGADPAKVWLSLLLRPLVVPEVPGKMEEKRLETRFFAPGNLASNLDFVESIFGNAGDPFLPSNDAGLDALHWTGHSGCVILAPHLVGMTKGELGLPHVEDATERQKAQGMCYRDANEPYNDGGAFKACLRTREGVVVTIIADNYFGYCKKEVKTQIGFSANMWGLAEEEHAGGALAFPSYHLGDVFTSDSRVPSDDHSIERVKELLGKSVDWRPEGHGIDKRFTSIHYVPQDAVFDQADLSVSWSGGEQRIKMLPTNVYILPSGYKVRLEKHPGAPTWRLVGTMPEGTFCHKPCTVSGGGKSEISKSLSDAVIYGSLYINDVVKDLALVEALLNKDYGDRLKPEFRPDRPSRPILSPERTLGSVIKMFTPGADFTDEYNAWLESLPKTIPPLIFIIKRFYKPEWGSDWQHHFGVDIVNGYRGHEFKYDGRKIVASYLRVGHAEAGHWRTYKLRQDFVPADKVQMEDDISASITMPAELVPDARPVPGARSVKIVQNCEFRLFQRPDDAIVRGYDEQAEADLAGRSNFISNFEPLTGRDARELVDDVVSFSQYSAPMQRLIRRASLDTRRFVVSSAHPRIVDGVPTKNPRYLQERPDLVKPRDRYLADLGMRLFRQVPIDRKLPVTVDATLPGRRNSPADPAIGVPALAVYNPLHYQELPELFMDFICSVTGKSPSTTGFGSEGAMTKGPFNCLPTTADLNNALVSAILTDGGGFTSAAGYVGPKVRVDHDVSLLVPELWSRMLPEERDPKFLITEGYLEPLEDYEFEGETILASRLGYRITDSFVRGYMGRIFDNPLAVFSEEMLHPEKQDPASFAEGVRNIVASQRRVAQAYLDDGTVSGAVPPIKALLHIMASGSYEGMTISSPEFRQMFTRDYLLKASWYQERLECKQQRAVAHWKRTIAYLERFLKLPAYGSQAEILGISERLDEARKILSMVERKQTLDEYVGTLGADPLQFS